MQKKRSVQHTVEISPAALPHAENQNVTSTGVQACDPCVRVRRNLPRTDRYQLFVHLIYRKR